MARTKHRPKDQKKNSGRKLKYTTPAALQKKVTAYFNSLKPTKTRLDALPPALTGLSVYLDFSDYSTFKDYEDNPEYSHIIKKARMKIAAAHEQNLFGKSCTGSIYWLKCNGGDMFKENPVEVDHRFGVIAVPVAATDDDEWHAQHTSA